MKRVFDLPVEADKPHEVAATAVMRKLVDLADVLLRQQRRCKRNAQTQAV